MTEKVKITQKQFDWLEKYKSDEEIDYAIDVQLHRKRPDSPIVDWKPSEVARAFYNGYKVEPEYKTGEWVRYWKSDSLAGIGLISSYKNVRQFVRFEGEEKWRETDCITSHATPEEIKAEKERRVWAGIGRETKQFRIGDIVINKSTIAPCVIGRTCYPSDGFIDSRAAERWYEEGKVAGIYPAESFVSFEEGDSE